MEELKVEYLVIINTENSFCSTKKSFNNLLSSFDNISINRNKIKHKNLEVEYELQTEKMDSDNQRFYHLKFVCKDLTKVDEFTQFLKVINEILNKATKKQPQKLWDDVSKFYSLKMYPIIHDIENLMRKLITKFMLTNIGLGWEKEVIPDEVKKSGRTKPANSNYLYEVDFIQLSKFLFLEYETVSFKMLFKKLRASKELSELNIDELKEFIPKSNWERYFSPIVNCENGYLESRWEKLYAHRCKVAHNNEFTKTDYEDAIRLHSEICDKIQSAIDNLDKIQLSEEDKEFIAENIASNTNELYGQFLNKWKLFTHTLYSYIREYKEMLIPDFAEKKDRFERHLKYNVRHMLKELSIEEHIGRYEILKVLELNQYKNILVHEQDYILDEKEMQSKLTLLDNTSQVIYDKINEIISEYIKKRDADKNIVIPLEKTTK